MPKEMDYSPSRVNGESDCIPKGADWTIIAPMSVTVTFREALLRALDSEGAPSLAEVCSRAGVSYQKISKVKQGKSATTSAEDAVKIANVFGLTLDEFLLADQDEAPHTVSLIYNRLPDQLRQRLETYGRGLLEGADSQQSESHKVTE